MKNASPIKIVLFLSCIVLIVTILIFSMAMESKKSKVDSQIQTIWHSSEDGEYNEIEFDKDGSYSSIGAISGEGTYRIDRNNGWIILTARNGDINVLYFNKDRDGTIAALTMKLSTTTSTLVPGPMPDLDQSHGKETNAISQSEYDMFSTNTVASLLAADGWKCNEKTIHFSNNTLYLDGEKYLQAVLTGARSDDGDSYSFPMLDSDGVEYQGQILCHLNETGDIVAYELTITTSNSVLLSAEHDGEIYIRQPA